jgi:hypothetical protein
LKALTIGEEAAWYLRSAATGKELKVYDDRAGLARESTLSASCNWERIERIPVLR